MTGQGDRQGEEAGPIRRLNVWIVMGVFAFSAFVLSLRIASLIGAGGDRWRQADWLVNFAAGPVRRGFSGEAFIALAGALQADLLSLLGGVQIALVLLIMGALLARFAAMGAPDAAALALISPAVVLFWVNDPGASFRKDLLLYLAFLPLLLPMRGRRGVLCALLASQVFFTVAVFFHEANAMFTGLYLFALLTRAGHVLSAQGLRLQLAGPILIAALAIVFALAFAHVPDAGPMCDRLLAHGFAPEFCTGIIAWMAQGLEANRQAVADNLHLVSVPESLGVAGLCAAPVVLAFGARIADWPRRLWAGIACAPVAVLFATSIDWGRWLAATLFCLTLVALLPRPGGEAEARRLPLPVWLGGLAIALFVGLYHVRPAFIGGLGMSVYRMVFG